MQIREFYGSESLLYRKLAVHMIRSGNEKLADSEAYARELEAQEAERPEGFLRLGVFEEDRLLATVRSEPYNIHLDGNIVKMAGIGGVIADHNLPKRGLIKELFRLTFQRMRENGQYVSHLYPFQANYYRQYGYEPVCKHCLWKIPVEYIPNDNSGGFVYYDGSPEMQKQIRDIYETFASGYNLSLVKDEKKWDAFFQMIVPYGGRYFSYLHYSDGVPDAFMSYKILTNPDRPQDLYAENLWFTTYRGLRGILSYFVTQKPYADRIWVRTPTNVDLSAYTEFQGGWAMRDSYCQLCFDGTTRVVDVEKLLPLLRYKGEGTVCIQIENDTYCPWNNDCFTLSFGEKSQVTRGGNPDIIMNINAFSAMILGGLSLDDGLIFPNVEIKGNREELEKVFYKKNNYIDEHF